MGRLLGIGLVAIAGAGLMVYGYTADEGLAFYSGVLLVAVSSGPAPLLLLRRHRSPAVLSAGMAVSLFLGFFILLEIGWRFRGEWGDPEPVYSFAAAQGDPEAFRRWWEHYMAEFQGTRDTFLMPDPRGVLPFVQRPGSWPFFKSKVRINSLGFRGPEIARQKGNRYRIVVLGSSTTWGATLRSDDTPWPEVLARRINSELACAVPIEVINAAIPGFPLFMHLFRLEHDIRPLAPDLLITYQGPEGFDFVGVRMASKRADVSRIVAARPSRVVGAVEGAVRRWHAGRLDAAALQDESAKVPYALAKARAVEANLLASSYAGVYRRFSTAVAAWPAKLIMCTYNLAVTERSPDEVIRFYGRGFPNVRVLVVANHLHNRLVTELGRKENIPVIDTSAGLDGAYEDAYVDVFHYTQAGRDRLAANVLAGLVPILAKDARTRCRPAGAPREPQPGG